MPIGVGESLCPSPGCGRRIVSGSQRESAGIGPRRGNLVAMHRSGGDARLTLKGCSEQLKM